MKYAIMSDVHASPRALETALADARAQKCEKFVFAGDVTGYGYDVNAALRLVRENFDVALMGNHDSVCAALESGWEVLMYAIYDSDAERVTLRRLPFDFKGYITEMLAHEIDLPSWLCDLLQNIKGSQA